MARILITGCSTGIGRAAAEEFTRRGHEVIATARSLAAIADLNVAERHELDVASAASVAALAATIDPVDAVINNAGTGLHGPLEILPMENIESIYQTNVFGTIRVIKAFLPAMRANGEGTIVFVSSAAAKATRPLTGTYGSTKAAVELILESLAFEVEGTGARVIVISPGAVSSDFPSRRITFDTEIEPYRTITDQWVKVRSNSHSANVTTPQEVATVMADLYQNESRPFSRHPVGAESAAILERRAASDDDTYRQSVWDQLRGV